MLERAARCLNSGTFQQYYPVKHAFQSRRTLHSAFWRHGAGDLDLPAWCFYTIKALFEPEHLRSAGDPDCSCLRPSNDGASCSDVCLDFLYPAKTQAMIKRLSRYGLRRWHRHVRSWTSEVNIRQYMSSARLDMQSVITTAPARSNVTEFIDKGGENALKPLQTDALPKLEMLLEAHKRGEYRESWKEAWELFSRLDPAQRAPRLVIGLMGLLGTSPRPLDTRRIIRLFELLSASERQSSSYFQVMLALLKLKEPGKAVIIHEEALRAKKEDLPALGTDILLAHLIAHRQWQLALYTYSNCMEFFHGVENLFIGWQKSFFEKLVKMPHIEGRVMSLLSAISKYPSMLPSENICYKTFIASLVRTVIDSGGNFGARRNRQVMEIMKQLGLSQPKLYEGLCLRTLESEGVPLKSRKENAVRIYEEYGKGHDFSPSRRLLHTLLKAAVDDEDRLMILQLLPDWYRYHGDLSLQLTGLLMKGFARGGDVDSVTEILSAFLSKDNEKNLQRSYSIKLFYPLLHAHALLADPVSVQAQMGRIEKEFRLKPDITCWNILLHAYQRIDDLDGALSTLSRLLEAGLTPDHYTLGTTMAVCAERADVDLCQQMVALAQYYKIPMSAVMNDCLVQACLNNEEPTKAESIAQHVTTTSKNGTHTRMWNQILAHHCLEQRPQNLPNTLRVARLMQKLKVRFDSMTYSAIMRAYVAKRRTDMARRILHKVIAKKNVAVHALHYAILIDGYANQLNFEKGLRMHTEMLERGIKPNISTQLALQKLHALAAEQKFIVDRASHPGLRLDVLDESLEEQLGAYDPTSIADKDPRLSSSRFNTAETYPAAYFDLPLAIYGKIRAYDVVKTLLEKYQSMAKSVTTPIRFIISLMTMHYREGDHSQVDCYWALAKTAAVDAAKTSKRAAGDTYLPPLRRTLLARHLDILLRSLDARPSSSPTDFPTRLLAAINDYFAAGFDLDNANWNLYVQLLATRGHHLAAFKTCERHLLARFPGWRGTEPRAALLQATGQKSPGTEFLGPRHTFLPTGELRATYKTMVRFAHVVRGLRRGAVFDRGLQEELAALEREAPRTVQAVLEMPMLDHPVATHVLGSRAARGQKRTLTA